MPPPIFPPSSDAEWTALLRQRPATGPRPFFYERVRARLLTRAEAPAALLPQWLRGPVRLALLAALVLAVSGDVAAVAGPGQLPGGSLHQR